MTTVVDASTVVAVVLGEGTPAEVEAMTRGVAAPALLDVEVTQTLRGLVRGAKLDLNRAEAAREALALLPILRYPDAVLLGRVWELRDVCTAYDGVYVALAEALDAPLRTRDARLARGVTSAGIACRVEVTR